MSRHAPRLRADTPRSSTIPRRRTRHRNTDMEIQTMPELTLSQAADPDPAWVARDLGNTGFGGVRERQIADHEAAHVATAYALGWSVLGAEIEDAGHGSTYFAPPAGRDEDRARRERLAITVAPSLLGACRSGGDSNEAMILAAEIGGRGEACMSSPRATSRALEQAHRDLEAVATTERFTRHRKIVRELLYERRSLDQTDLAVLMDAEPHELDQAIALVRNPGLAKRKPTPATATTASATPSGWTPPPGSKLIKPAGPAATNKRAA